MSLEQSHILSTSNIGALYVLSDLVALRDRMSSHAMHRDIKCPKGKASWFHMLDQEAFHPESLDYMFLCPRQMLL